MKLPAMIIHAAPINTVATRLISLIIVHPPFFVKVAELIEYH